MKANIQLLDVTMVDTSMGDEVIEARIAYEDKEDAECLQRQFEEKKHVEEMSFYESGFRAMVRPDKESKGLRVSRILYIQFDPDDEIPDTAKCLVDAASYVLSQIG